MLDYKKLYLLLFHGISSSLQAMEDLNFGQARRILQQAQREAEAQYCEDTEKEAV